MTASTIHSHEHSHLHHGNSVFEKRPLLTGIAVGIGTLLPHAFLPPQASLAFAAIVIALIAGIYFGFAVVNGSPKDQMVEFNVTGLFAVAGLLGLLLWPVLLPLAYFGHAAWDLAHHNRSKLSLVAIPQWYVPWCIVIDVIVGTGLFVIWNADGIL
jgi:4-amino-4-deoxy-L-arabinose transferase-like glycosyltransferase